ncbi:OsmC family protein [Thiomonas sp.]|uniref:OsmC family protein n=1 Tax=Thiomonas sp. TaxID=2047785 RepID=UPI002618E911|nr:OsmC family protein [Thiomonas sp.]
MDDKQPRVTLQQVKDYQFDIRYADDRPAIRSDEPPPLGAGAGPSPSHLLLAAVGNCMSSSLYFALTKFKLDPQGLTTHVSGDIGRNAAGRLRVLSIAVDIHMGAGSQGMERLDRVLQQFEQFCTVGESVRQGIPVTVSVYDGNGQKLK